MPKGFFRRMRFTPMRDWMRGRLSGCLDVVSFVEQAGLPTEVRSLILHIVRRTRLWRREKIDVAMELIAHFQDGLEAGRSADELVETFGDIKQTAKLIRRGKKRNRPMWWKMSRRCGQGLVCCFVIYATVGIILLQREPNVSVNYLALLNERIHATPVEDYAWPIYREALIAVDGDIDQWIKVVFAENSRKQNLVSSDDPQWKNAVAFLSKHQDLLEAIRTGAKKPVVGIGLRLPTSSGHFQDLSALDVLPAIKDNPLEKMPALIGTQPVALGYLRLMARLMAVDMRWAAFTGDSERVVENYQTILGLAHQSQETPTLISGFVSISLSHLANKHLIEVLHRQPQLLTNAQWAHLAHEAAAVHMPLDVWMKGEGAFFRDMIQRMYSDDGRGDGTVTLQGLNELSSGFQGLTDTTEKVVVGSDTVRSLALPAAVALMGSRKEILSNYERLIQFFISDSQRPLWEILGHSSRVDKQIKAWQHSHIDRMRYWPLIQVMPAMGAAVSVNQSHDAVRDALVVAIGLELYRREHGDYPASLDSLVPKYLPSVPPDRSSGLPMCYKIFDGKPLLYGRGLDGDNDGGQVMPGYYWPRLDTVAEDAGGDWVLYPPPGEGD